MVYERQKSTGRRMPVGILAGLVAVLAVGFIPAAAAVGPSLGAARSFAALGGSTLTNTGSTTSIVGDVGVSPGSAIAGLTQSQVDGGIYVGGDAEADQAHGDAALAYAHLAGMASDVNLTSTDLGGLTLAPGVYTFNSSAALTGEMFLDAGGDSNAVFVFQIGTTLTTASGSSVTVIDGGADYDESNIYWQVGSSATIGSTTAFLGVIIADQSVTLATGATLTGNALALNGATSLDSNAVSSPTLVGEFIAAPINVRVVLAGTPVSPRADLSWNDSSDNETDFRVYRRDGAAPGFALIGTVPSTDTPGTGGVVVFTDTGVATQTTYTYRVTAFDGAVGQSTPSDEALVTTGDIFPAILSPTNVTAVLSGNARARRADVSWTDASDNETGFRVYRRDGAGPDFVLVGTVATSDTPGTNGTRTFQDTILDASRTFAYRVTAFNLSDGESVPSNQALVDTGAGPAVRWLDLDLGRGRSKIVDRKREGRDQIVVKGSFSVIDVASGVPTVLDDLDPRIDGVSVQVRAAGSLVLLDIPAGDPNWKVSKRKIYRWSSRVRGGGQRMFLRINPRKSAFTFRSNRIEFGSVPVNDITVSLSVAGAMGSDSRDWGLPNRGQGAGKTLFRFPK